MIEFPMEDNKLSNKGELLTDPCAYQCLVGRLIYLTIIRPDITYSFHILSRFMHEPLQTHMVTTLWVVSYFKSSPGEGLLLNSNNPLNLSVYCDSDWAGYPITHHSTTRYCVFLWNSLISWRTKRQKIVSLSSVEVEYRAMTSRCVSLLGYNIY